MRWVGVRDVGWLSDDPILIPNTWPGAALATPHTEEVCQTLLMVSLFIPSSISIFTVPNSLYSLSPALACVLPEYSSAHMTTVDQL